MEIEGQVIIVLPLQTGNSTKGAWQKREFVIETPGQFARKVCLTLFGEKVSDCPAVGDSVKVSINLESREYNGRYYTEAKAWKVVKTSIDNRQPPTWASTPTPQPEEKPANFKGSGDDWDKLNSDDDSLPF